MHLTPLYCDNNNKNRRRRGNVKGIENIRIQTSRTHFPINAFFSYESYDCFVYGKAQKANVKKKKDRKTSFVKNTFCPFRSGICCALTHRLRDKA